MRGCWRAQFRGGAEARRGEGFEPRHVGVDMEEQAHYSHDGGSD